MEYTIVGDTSLYVSGPEFCVDFIYATTKRRRDSLGIVILHIVICMHFGAGFVWYVMAKLFRLIFSLARLVLIVKAMPMVPL